MQFVNMKYLYTRILMCILARRDNMTLKDRLREQRIEKGLTQIQLARKTGLKQGTLANYEKGKNVPSSIVLSKIATALDVTIEWLLNGGIKSTSRFLEQIIEIYANKKELRNLQDDDHKLELIIEHIKEDLGLSLTVEVLRKEKQQQSEVIDSLLSNIKELKTKIGLSDKMLDILEK
jgi:transcriptional regulator with XRE-family HTH domain